MKKLNLLKKFNKKMVHNNLKYKYHQHLNSCLPLWSLLMRTRLSYRTYWNNLTNVVKYNLYYYTVEVEMVGCVKTSTVDVIIRVQLLHYSKLKTLVKDVVVILLSTGSHHNHLNQVMTLMLSYSVSILNHITLFKYLRGQFFYTVDVDLTLDLVVMI